MWDLRFSRQWGWWWWWCSSGFWRRVDSVYSRAEDRDSMFLRNVGIYRESTRRENPEHHHQLKYVLTNAYAYSSMQRLWNHVCMRKRIPRQPQRLGLFSTSGFSSAAVRSASCRFSSLYGRASTNTRCQASRKTPRLANLGITGTGG
jgi:hypothetical protein